MNLPAIKWRSIARLRGPTIVPIPVSIHFSPPSVIMVSRPSVVIVPSASIRREPITIAPIWTIVRSASIWRVAPTTVRCIITPYPGQKKPVRYKLDYKQQRHV